MSGKCNKSGMCCTMFWLPKSPQQLKQLAKDYVKNEWYKNEKNWRYDEIYRMIGDRCLGKHAKENYWLYGPCRNLYFTTNANGTREASCAIQSIKPDMCQGFPYVEKNNPSTYKGCGYNNNKKSGITLRQLFAKVKPLSQYSDEEKELFGWKEQP